MLLDILSLMMLVSVIGKIMLVLANGLQVNHLMDLHR